MPAEVSDAKGSNPFDGTREAPMGLLGAFTGLLQRVKGIQMEFRDEIIAAFAGAVAGVSFVLLLVAFLVR